MTGMSGKTPTPALIFAPLGGIDAVAPSSTTKLDEKKIGERRNFARKDITGHVGHMGCMVQSLPSSKLYTLLHPHAPAKNRC